MILSTHAVVGAAIASLIPTHPGLALTASFASHFVIDAIPHWDCPLRAISPQAKAGRMLAIDRNLFRGLAFIGLDAMLGLALSLAIFARPTTIVVVLLGAFAAMVPDPLQVIHRLYPFESPPNAATLPPMDPQRHKIELAYRGR